MKKKTTSENKLIKPDKIALERTLPVGEPVLATPVRPDWDQLYITMCYLVGMRSRDEHTHVGSVIVDSDNVLVSTGYNSLPRKIESEPGGKRLSREGGEKYFWLEHAERNAIYNAARRGTVLKGCKIYIPWMPCADCARGIIQCGISEVIVHKNGEEFYNSNTSGQWVESHRRTMQMFDEAGVITRYVTCDVITPEIYMNAEIFNPEKSLNN
ncbi:MAG: comEB [Ignavibacteria bacterium]|nr:comEB [Ignavibacteria bacterium]